MNWIRERRSRGAAVALHGYDHTLARSARRSAVLDAVDAALNHGAQPSTYSAIVGQLDQAA